MLENRSQLLIIDQISRKPVALDELKKNAFWADVPNEINQLVSLGWLILQKGKTYQLSEQQRRLAEREIIDFISNNRVNQDIRITRKNEYLVLRAMNKAPLSIADIKSLILHNTATKELEILEGKGWLIEKQTSAENEPDLFFLHPLQKSLLEKQLKAFYEFKNGFVEHSQKARQLHEANLKSRRQQARRRKKSA
jgi:hypothetical protein